MSNDAKLIKSVAVALNEKVAAVQYQDEDRGYLGGSEIAGCQLKTVWKHTGAPITNPRSRLSSRRLALGHIIEAWVIEDYQDALEGEDKITLHETGDNQAEYHHEESGVVMHPDGRLEIAIGQAPINVNLEIKSASEKNLKRMRAEGVYPEHVGQSQLTMRQSGIEYTLFHIVDALKMQDSLVGVMPYSAEAGDVMSERAIRIAAKIEEISIDPASPNLDAEPSVLCQYCVFQNACVAKNRSPSRASVGERKALVEPTKYALATIEKIGDAKAQIKELTEVIERGQEVVEKELGDADGFKLPQRLRHVKVYKQQVKPSVHVDSNKMVESLSVDQLAECTVEKPGYGRVVVKVGDKSMSASRYAVPTVKPRAYKGNLFEAR